MQSQHGAEVQLKMVENITITINNQTVDVPPGTLIVEAAKKIGVEIPTFCYDDRLKPVGACRMCLVEVEKMPKLIASCATPVAPNMVIHTESEKVIEARKGVLEFQLINHPLDCPTCDKGGECPLQDNTYLYGPEVSVYKEDKIRFIDEEADQKFDDVPLGPEIIFNGNRCIMCFKCTRIVRDLAGEADLGVFDRGSSSYIDIINELEFSDEYSGNTVEYCPVGALTSRSFRYKIRDWLLKKTPSVCNLCPVGCNMHVEWSKDKVYRHMARRNDKVDSGWLCDRGRYGFDISRNENRITRTHIRRGSLLEACSWEEAAALAVKHLSKLIDENRGAEIAAVGSARLSNEEAYSIRKFFSETIKTEYIDFQTDIREPLEKDLIENIGLDGEISDLENDDLFIFVRCDPAVEFPVASLKIRSAISKYGAKAVFISSYDKRLGYFPVTNIRIPNGTEAFALNYLSSQVSGLTYDMPASVNIDNEALKSLSAELKSQKKIHIITGRGLYNHHDRKGFVSSLVNFKKAIGSKLSLIPASGNFMGVSRLGLYGGRGHSFTDILAKIDSGQIKALFAFGSNPVDEFPDRKYAHDTLKKLEFFIVVSPFMNATTELASMVFPQALPSGYNGSFINLEGRVQRFEKGPENPHFEMRPVWAILGEFNDLLGLGTIWQSDSQLRDEIAKNIKGMQGITDIPDQGSLLYNNDKNNFDPNAASAVEPPKANADLPFVLNSTSSVHHDGWITQKSDTLMNIDGNQAAWIHPGDAGAMELESGQVVRIGNEETAINIPVKITNKVSKGEILIVNSIEENPVNRLLKLDEKTTFVSVRKT